MFRRIRWKIEKEYPSLLPNFSQFFYFPISVDRSIVQDNNRFLRYLERKSIKIIHYLVGVYGFLRSDPLILIPPGNHAKDVKSCGFFRWDINILIFELPTVWHIAIRAYVTFIGIIQYDFAFGIKCFKFLQLLFLVCVELR